ESDEEAGHTLVGHGQDTGLGAFEEERHHRATAADHVPVAHYGETRALGAGVGVPLDEELVAYQFGRAVEVHGATRLVRTQRHDTLDSAIDARVDDVLGALD